MGLTEMRRDLAESNGWFWLPCPVCREHMAGYEWRDVHGHESSIPDLGEVPRDGVLGPGQSTNSSTGICPGCTALGIGCYTHARLDGDKYRSAYLRHDCPETWRGLKDAGRSLSREDYHFPLSRSSE